MSIFQKKTNMICEINSHHEKINIILRFNYDLKRLFKFHIRIELRST